MICCAIDLEHRDSKQSNFSINIWYRSAAIEALIGLPHHKYAKKHWQQGFGPKCRPTGQMDHKLIVFVMGAGKIARLAGVKKSPKQQKKKHTGH